MSVQRRRLNLTFLQSEYCILGCKPGSMKKKSETIQRHSVTKSEFIIKHCKMCYKCDVVNINFRSANVQKVLYLCIEYPVSLESVISGMKVVLNENHGTCIQVSPNRISLPCLQ